MSKVKPTILRGGRHLSPRSMETMMLMSPFAPETSKSWSPAVDIRESDAAYVITAELPGLTKNEVSVVLDGDILTISGERALGAEAKSFSRIEGHYGEFSRKFAMPQHVNPQAVKAEFNSGVLTVMLPKTDRATNAEIWGDFDRSADVQRVQSAGEDFVLVKRRPYEELIDRLESLDTSSEVQRARAAVRRGVLELVLDRGLTREQVQELARADSFGGRLAILRQALGVDQKRLAEESGVSQSTISKLEHGKVKRLSFDTVQRLLEALGLPGDSILPFYVGELTSEIPRTKGHKRQKAQQEA